MYNTIKTAILIKKHLRTVTYKNLALFVGCLLFSISNVAAQNDTTTIEYTRKTRPAYTLIGVGLGRLTFRDFSTSPLYYTGIKGSVLVGRLRADKKLENCFYINLMAGITSSSFNQTSNSSLYFNPELYYQRIYRLQKLSTGKWNTKMGGAFMSSSNVRINSSLLNNAYGFENISNLMLSTKVSRNISRTEEKSKKFLFIKWKLKPKKRFLSYQLNLGILNFNYRPGYAYSYEDEMNGTNSKLISNYKFEMNGYRLNTQLCYTKYLPNGNGIQYAYIWDIASAPGRYESFQMASHTLQISILFNTK